MGNNDKQLETAVEKVVERMADSKQPAFGGDAAVGEFAGFGTVLRWAYEEAPPYDPDTRLLDAWLRDFVQREPHLSGVVAQATSLVRNRGWSLTGGRNTVSRVKAMMHDADRRDGAARGEGYRHYITRIARSFYITNIGAISENGRDAAPRMMNGMVTAGPLRSMWSTDSTRFRLRPHGTKNYPLREFPLAYYPQGGKVQYWRHADFFRIVANPSTDDRMMGAGFSGVAMARELAEIMTAVYQHDKEMLGARAPKGLLILQNIDEPMWDAAMKSRKEKLDGMEREYFGGVAVLAQAGVEQADAKLVALSSLPTGFSQREMIDLLMYLYALVFGFSPDEFWPVRGGSFGRGAEAEIGVERATRKGDKDFFSAFQEKLQAELPATVLLEYEERSDSGRLIEAQLEKIYAEVATMLYEAGAGTHPDGPLWNQQMTLSYLIERGMVDPVYTDVVEEVEVEDTDIVRTRKMKERLMDTSDQVRAAVEWQKGAIERRGKGGPAYDIVRYLWPSNRVVELWPANEYPHYGKLHRVAKKRAVLFEDEDTGLVITDKDVDTAVADAGDRLGEEFAQVLEAPTKE